MEPYIRFVHASDIHLGAPFQTLLGLDERMERMAASAIPDAYEALIDLTIREEADFLILAGDVFDSRSRTYSAFALFVAGMERLADHDIPVYVTTGNHDPSNSWLHDVGQLPDNVRIFDSAEPQRYEFRTDGVLKAVLHGQGYAHQHEARDLASAYRPLPDEPLSIGVLHTGLVPDSYAPTSVERLRSTGMDYWALGHVHEPAILNEYPHIVYSGSPQGLNINQDSPHGAYVVTYAAPNAAPELVYHDLESFAWRTLAVDITGITHSHELENALIERIGVLQGEKDVSYIIRFDLFGADTIADPLTETDLAQMATHINSRFTGSTWVWVDRIRDSSSPAVDRDAALAADLLPAYVFRAADELAADPTELGPDFQTLLDEAEIPRPDDAGLAALLERASFELAQELSGGGRS